MAGTPDGRDKQLSASDQGYVDVTAVVDVDGDGALRTCQRPAAPEWTIDLALIDLGLPDGSGGGTAWRRRSRRRPTSASSWTAA